MRLVLNRFFSNQKWTLGTISFGDTFLFTLELPWKDNEKNKSCIPTGIYKCELTTNRKTLGGKKIAKAYEIRDVPNRSGILIHAGNSVKDTSGCILLGSNLYHLNGALISESRVAVRKFHTYLKDREVFELEIK